MNSVTLLRSPSNPNCTVRSGFLFLQQVFDDRVQFGGVDFIASLGGVVSGVTTEINRTTYPQQQWNRAALLDARQENLLRLRWLVLGVPVVHPLEDQAVQHDPTGTVSAHDHAPNRLPIGVLAKVQFKGANSALLPLLVEVE